MSPPNIKPIAMSDQMMYPVERRDAGMALPLVLILTSVIAVMVISLANMAATNLRFGRIAENRSDRLTAADAGMRYAIDQLKLRNAGCILDTQKAVLPGLAADFNGATAAVTCERITSGFEGIQAYAAVMTGEGLSPTTSLLSSQSGSNEKILGGPVYMSRLTNAFELSPPVNIKDGPLLYHDSSGVAPCKSVKASTLPTNLVFEPKLIFGPVCVSVPWTELFKSPDVPDLTDLTVLPVRNGALPLNPVPVAPAAAGSYTDVPGEGGCRVFEPGRYTTPPALTGVNAYFKTGNYVFDFPDANSTLLVDKSVVTAGKVNPLTTAAAGNEIVPTIQCSKQQLADTGAGFGATFYFAGKSHIRVATQGSMEIHARLQGTTDYVSVQTLCTPNGTWCKASGGGGLGKPSTLTGLASGTNPAFLYTDSGNKKEFVAHGLVYAPLAQIEFGNVTNTATQKMLGGLIVSRLVLQSSTSATNFEIAVPTSPITARIQLTSVAEKDGKTAIQAVVEYRPYESDIEGRVRVNSWRVCETADCAFVVPPPPPTGDPCATAEPKWKGEYWNDSSAADRLVGVPDLVRDDSTIDFDWAAGSPDSKINPDNFSARWSRKLAFVTDGTYKFTVKGDDGLRVFIDGSPLPLTQVGGSDAPNSWSIHASRTYTGQIALTGCVHDVVMEFFENTLQAEARLSWTKVG